MIVAVFIILSFVYIDVTPDTSPMYRSNQLKQNISQIENIRRIDYVDHTGIIRFASDVGYATKSITKADDSETEEYYDENGVKVSRYSGYYGIKKEYDQNVDRGITIQQYGDTYRLLTKKENHDILTLIYDTKTKSPLTQSLLETLAIVAYNQPCPSSLIEKIRGHNALNGLEKLTKLDLIKCIGRANTPGKPYLYEITNKFYDLFGIKSMKELPNINENINLDDLDNSFDFFDSSKEDGKTKKN